MSDTHYAIIVAMEREIAALVKGWDVYLGNRQKFFERKDAIVVCGGLGAAAAQDATEAVIARRSPQIIVSAGYAGALTNSLAPGDIVVPAEVVDANTFERFTALKGSGVLVSGSSVAGTAAKRDFAARYKADAVDMEAAAVARTARTLGRDFLAVKAISDELDFEMPSMDRFISSTGEFQSTRFALHTALHPSLWPAVRKLARNSHRASLRLCAALDHLISGQDPATLISDSAHAGRGLVH